MNVLQNLTDTISASGEKTLRKMSLNRLDSSNIKSYSSIHQSEYFIGNDTSLYNRGLIVPDLLYKESLKIVKHYVKKHYRIRSSFEALTNCSSWIILLATGSVSFIFCQENRRLC